MYPFYFLTHSHTTAQVALNFYEILCCKSSTEVCQYIQIFVITVQK